MYNKPLDIRFNAVRHYLENGESLRKTAKKFGVNYWNVYEWVKSYKTKGEEGILSRYKRPRCRAPEKIEEKVVLLKERMPALTVRQARRLLEKEGIKISLKGIWGIWKRYGYAGFKRENMTNEFIEYCPWTKEARYKFLQAKELMSIGKTKEATRILNSIPLLPQNDILYQIPDNLLNIKRKVERICALFGKVPISHYLKKVDNLYHKLRQRNLNYSALRAGIVEVIALSWLGKPEQQIKKMAELRGFFHTVDRTNKERGSYLLFEPRFTIAINEGISYAMLMNIGEAKKSAERARKSLRIIKNPSPYFLFNLGRLYTYLEEYRKAEYYFLKAVDGVGDSVRNYIKGILARIFFGKNEFKKAVVFARSAEFGVWLPNNFRLVFKALLSLMNAQPDRAIALAIEALSQSKKEGIGTIIFGAHLIMASAYCSLGDKKRAKVLLERSLHFFNKNNLRREKTIFSILHTLVLNVNHTSNISPPGKHTLPTIKLALLIKNRKYSQSLSYARKKYLMHYFYNYIFLASEKIKDFVEKGEKIGLPKIILRLPIFNKEALVYYIKFVGSLMVFKNQKYLKTKLKPKDYAFLIYLCTKAMEPKKAINLEEVYKNFWPRSETASRNFSHLLVRIKKALKIPTHLLTVSWGYGESVLINEGIYFTTDLQEFEQTLAQAKALERAGEWGFARKEYLRAFKLFRGEPFKKNFDDWSVDMRFKILSSLETEAVNFAKSCLEHKNKQDAKRVLEKVLKIIPDSEEIKNLLNSNFRLRQGLSG